MPNFYPSANMLLPIPVAGVQVGPDYALNVNASLTLIDAHDHSPGKGVPITPSGINITADLSFNNNNAIALRSARFTAEDAVLAEPTDLDCLYVVGVDLYYNDGNGNNVRITESGGVAGTPGSISNLTSPASASYVSASSKFVWQSAANVAASLDCRNVILRNSGASSFGLTLSPPSGMASNFGITLPSLPVSTKIMTMDTGGNIVASVSVDNSSIELATNVLQVKDSGITTAKIADGNVTRPKLVAVGQQISSSSGTATTSSGTFSDVTNLLVNITTTGRPVILFLQGETTAWIGANNSASGTAIGEFRIVRDTSTLVGGIFVGNTTSSSAITVRVPPGSFILMDTPAAGTYEYKVQYRVEFGSGCTATNVKLVAYEL